MTAEVTETLPTLPPEAPTDALPPLEAAKGRRYYLLHSPQDRVCRYVFARTAKTQLTEAGATVASLEISEPELEEVFVKIMRREAGR